jgi:hypothetical protein
VSVCPAASSAARTCADLAVHHPAQPEDVGSRRRLRQRHVGIPLEGGVVVDGPVRSEHSAVAVVGELVQAQVGHDDEVVTDRLDDRARATLRMPSGSSAPDPARPWWSGTPKTMIPPSPACDAAAGLLDEGVERVLDDTGHGRDGLGDKERQHEIGRAHPVLLDQATDAGGAAQPPRPLGELRPLAELGGGGAVGHGRSPVRAAATAGRVERGLAQQPSPQHRP